MLQTDDGLVPLTEDQLWNYLDTITEQCYDENGKLDLDKLMQLDATGLDEDINGVMMRVKGMIAGVEGGTGNDGKPLTRADILAISGSSNEEIIQDYYGDSFDPESVVGMGNLSRYVGKSMHDAQAVAQEGKDNIEAVYDQLYNDLENGSSGESDGSSSASVRYVDHIKSAFEILADSLGKDAGEMTISDVVGLSQDGVQLTDEQAQALDTLTAAADKYGTTIQGVAEAGEENGLFGGIENAQNGIAAAAQDMDTISKKIDEIQSAYKACTTAMDEYNKYGYMSADALQGLLSMSDEYLACLDVVDGKLQINNDRYADLIATQYTEAETTAIEQAVSELNALQKEDAKEKTEGLTTATEEQQTALENAIPAIKDTTVATGDLAVALAAAQGAAEGDEAMQAKIETVTNALNTKLTAIHTNMQAALNSGAAVRNQLKGFDKDSKKSGKTSSKSVTDVASAFDTLTKAMKEYNQYGYISADTMKSMMKLEDKFTSCLVKNGDKLEINANEFRKLVETQLKQEEASGKASKSADELKRILSYLDSNVHSSTISFEQLTDVIKGYGTAMDEAKEKTDAIKSAFSGLSEVSKNKIDNPFGALDADDVDKQYQAIRDLYDNTDLFTNEKYVGALNIDSGTINYNSDAFKQMFLASLDKMASAARKTGGVAGEYLAQGFENAKEEIAGNIISVEEYINGLGSTLENINNRMDNFQSAFNDLSDISEEYNTYGDLSQDSIQKLMGLDVKYIACLDLQGDKLVFNKEAFRALYVEQLRKLAADYEGTEIGKRYAEILQKVADGAWDVTDHMKGMGTETEKITSLFSNLKDIFSSFLDLIENANSKKDSDLKLWGEAMTEDIDKRIDALNKQKEALQEANDEEERAITLAKLKAELEKARTQRTVRKLTSNGYEWVADESAVKEAQDNLNDQQREWRKEDAEKAIDDQIDKLNELKDKYSEIISLIGTDWDDYNKKLKYASEIADMTFTEMEGRVDVFKGNVLASMQAANPISTIKKIISGLESLISTLEKVGNVLDKLDGGSGNGGITTLWNKITNLFNGKNTNNTQTAFGNFWNNLSQVGRNGVNKLQNVIFGGWNKITSGTSGFLSNVGNFFGGA